MHSRFRLVGAVGVLLMASAIAFPWVKTGPTTQAVDAIPGFGHGIEVVLGLAGVGALALLWGNRIVTFSTACIAAAWTALVMYELPGTLVSAGGIGIAEMSWGALLALSGSVVLAVAALPRPRDFARPAATSAA